jgi:hypothetical protein
MILIDHIEAYSQNYKICNFFNGKSYLEAFRSFDEEKLTE